MKKIKAIIEKSTSGLCSVYVPSGTFTSCSLSGQGWSIEEAKRELMIVLEEMREITNNSELDNIEFTYIEDF